MNASNPSDRKAALNMDLTRLALLADSQAIRNIARGVQAKQSRLDVGGMLTAVLIFCVFFVGVWLVSRLMSRHDRAISYRSPRSLFRALCRAHQLGRAERQLLRRLAREHRLSQPALVFVEPERFNAEALSSAWRNEQARLRALRERLFAG
jgi:hypothetical protein